MAGAQRRKPGRAWHAAVVMAQVVTPPAAAGFEAAFYELYFFPEQIICTPIAQFP